jgi:hypothetical protein
MEEKPRFVYFKEMKLIEARRSCSRAFDLEKKRLDTEIYTENSKNGEVKSKFYFPPKLKISNF